MGDPDEITPAEVDTDVELPSRQWRSLTPELDPAAVVRFVDGVRRVDARLWMTDDAGVGHPGIAASYAAGVACCDEQAIIESCEVRRIAVSGHPVPFDVVAGGFGLYTGEPVTDGSDAGLTRALHDRMGELERLVAGMTGEGELVIVDGPLRSRAVGTSTIGYIKTHQTAYLSGSCAAVVSRLTPGARTPIFRISSRGGWAKWSWYVRLPGHVDHAWEAIARCEAGGQMPHETAIRLADTCAATLPRFASQQYKDPRAPQNLHPIAALERQLRRRLGDPGLAVRALRRGAAHLNRSGGLPGRGLSP